MLRTADLRRRRLCRWHACKQQGSNTGPSDSFPPNPPSVIKVSRLQRAMGFAGDRRRAHFSHGTCVSRIPGQCRLPIGIAASRTLESGRAWGPIQTCNAPGTQHLIKSRTRTDARTMVLRRHNPGENTTFSGTVGPPREPGHCAGNTVLFRCGITSERRAPTFRSGPALLVPSPSPRGRNPGARPPVPAVRRMSPVFRDQLTNRTLFCEP